MNNILYFLSTLLGSSGVFMMSPVWRGDRGRWFIGTVAVATVAVAGSALGVELSGRDGETTGTITGTTTETTTGTIANIWVDTTGSGSCSDNSSLVSYAPGITCATVDSAFASAEPGDVIGIHSGAYPFVTLAYRAGLQNLVPGCDPYGTWGTASTSNCIKFIPDGDVKLRGMVNNASSVWLRGNVTGTTGNGCSNPQACENRTYDFHITTSDLIGNPPSGASIDANCNCKSATFRAARPAVTSNTSQRPDHVIIDGIDSDTISIYASDKVYSRNGDIGPLWVDTSIRGSSSGSGPDIPRIWNAGSAGPAADIVFDGAYFHEINRTFWCDVNNACHPDGLYINSGGPITINASAFKQISGEVLFFENFSNNVPNTHDVTVTNSWFGCKVNSYPDNLTNYLTACGSGPPIDFKNCGSSGCSNFLFRYNSWHSIGGAETDWTNSRFIGNAGKQPGATEPVCSVATWNFNAFYTGSGGSNCGATNVNSGSSSPSSIFTNIGSAEANFHLSGAVGSTVADNLVTPTTPDYTISPDLDMDGQTRTPGSRDAGADER